MKNFAVVYNGGNDVSKYVGSLSDYKAGEFSADPILMSEEEANELLKELDNYVRNEEYIGNDDNENDAAHWNYEQGRWGFQVEEIADIISTLQDLADYINGCEEFDAKMVEGIIEDNGWVNLCGNNDYDVCSYMGEKVTLDENTCEAKVVDDNSINERIGQRIQELRKEAGMTQVQLAEKCGMAQPNIARIEAGTYATSIDVLSRIAEALGKRIELV